MGKLGANDLTIDTRGIDELMKKTKPALYREPLAELFRDLGTTAQRTAIQRAPRFTGALQRSIHLDVRPLSARVFSNLNYAVPVEVGRSRNRTPPPVPALRRWANSKGINVYALVKSIGRRGIKGRFFMRAARQAVERKLPFQLKLAERRIAARWSKNG
jgi:hypothetical protein